MIELQPEHKPYFYISAVMLSIEVLYFLNLANEPKSGWAVYFSLIALSVSVPMLVGACLGFMVGYKVPARNLLLAGLIFGLLWFMLALAAISKVASIIAILVSIVSYKILQYHHKYLRAASASAQPGTQADGPVE
jgi:hypothetical protein